MACFLAGTRIMTDRGPVAVERLSAGAQVLTASGEVRPVRRIGHRRIDCTRHPAPQSVRPVRIHAGAFGPRLPSRDLLLSPDQAVFDGGVLIPARYLVNGTSVRQEPRDCATYYHVELDSHDVILAEHLPCESFLDTGNRTDFDNAGAVVRLHPDFARHAWHTRACAPLAVSGATVIAARQKLLARATSLGHPLTGEPALHAIADGERLRASLTGHTLRMRVPATRTGLRLLSRSAIPAETHCDGTDHRRLGVAVRAMRYAGRNLPLDSQRLGGGWHALEHEPDGGSWRWTNGDAAIGLPGGASLEVDVLLTERYWLPPAPLRHATSRRTS